MRAEIKKQVQNRLKRIEGQMRGLQKMMEDEKYCVEVGGTPGHRADDDPAKFAIRWEQFLNRTKPVIDYYQAQGRVVTLDGSPAIAEVQASVLKALQERGSAEK